MEYVDTFSRSFDVLIVEVPLEWNLMVLQNKNSKMKKIAEKLKVKEDLIQALQWSCV